MRNRILVLLAGLALVTVPVFAVQPQRSVASAPVALQTPEGGVLYDQNNNVGTNSITSQNFEAANDAFDGAAADDFQVPSGVTWTVNEVFIPGVYFNGTGPVASVDVNFYADSGGLPGAVQCTASGIVPTDAAGTFNIVLTVPCVLSEGSYWVSVIANMDLVPGGQWGWTERTVQSFNPSAWQNPGGGFATPCTTWGARVGLCAVGTDLDLAFTLFGTEGTAASLIEVPTLGAWGLAALALLLAAVSIRLLRRRRAA